MTKMQSNKPQNIKTSPIPNMTITDFRKYLVEFRKLWTDQTPQHPLYTTMLLSNNMSIQEFALKTQQGHHQKRHNKPRKIHYVSGDDDDDDYDYEDNQDDSNNSEEENNTDDNEMTDDGDVELTTPFGKNTHARDIPLFENATNRSNQTARTLSGSSSSAIIDNITNTNARAPNTANTNTTIDHQNPILLSLLSEMDKNPNLLDQLNNLPISQQSPQPQAQASLPIQQILPTPQSSATSALATQLPSSAQVGVSTSVKRRGRPKKINNGEKANAPEVAATCHNNLLVGPTTVMHDITHHRIIPCDNVIGQSSLQTNDGKSKTKKLSAKTTKPL